MSAGDDAPMVDVTALREERDALAAELGRLRAAARHRISPREREVVDLVVVGRSTADIAIVLGISVKTVEAHRTGINRKLGTHSPADLVRVAAGHAAAGGAR